MSTTTKNNTWKLILQLIVSIATAIATTLGVTSCMGANTLM
ncbi:MAG: smalltalk protein [Prevotella sp.]